jgi:signal transduction histidine kinase
MKKFSRIVVNLPFHTVASLRERLMWYVNLRWIAATGLFISVPVSEAMLGFNIGYSNIIGIAVLLVFTNIIYLFVSRHINFKSEIAELAFAEVQIITDLLFVSFIIHYSGGIENPFFFLYIVQVILSGILFPGVILPYINALFAAFLLTMWTIAEYSYLTVRYSIRTDPLSLPLIITALAAFYITNFAGIYIINNFMIGYRALKKIIDEKNRELETAMVDRIKTFRYAAHELKAPMVAIQSTLSVVRDVYSGELKSEVKDMVIKAETRASQLLNIIKEMIMISQYNLGIEKPDISEVNFNHWLEQLIRTYNAYAIQKKIKFIFIPSDEFYATLDTTGMEKVIANLINNAIRYTPQGGTVSVRSFYTDLSFGFTVSDTGIGIDNADLTRIFDEFYRGKNAKDMERLGTGLGLNLVKEIVQFNNGTISVKSELGKGSEFMVEFPLTAAGIPSAEEEEKFFLLFE